MKLLPVMAIGLGLSGCSTLLQAAVGGGSGGLVGQAENLVPELILQKYQALHNLKVGMETIDASAGPVTMTMPAPVVLPAPNARRAH